MTSKLPRALHVPSGLIRQEERIGFDNQLGAVERTLQAKTKDYEELLLLSGDANHAREVSS